MAILIPSKNIYNPKHNKIEKNRITNVSVTENYFYPKTQLIGYVKNVNITEIGDNPIEIYSDTKKNQYATTLSKVDNVEYYSTNLTFDFTNIIVSENDIKNCILYTKYNYFKYNNFWQFENKSISSVTVGELIENQKNKIKSTIGNIIVNNITLSNFILTLTLLVERKTITTTNEIVNSYSIQPYGTIYEILNKEKNYSNFSKDGVSFSLTDNELQQSSNKYKPNEEKEETISLAEQIASTIAIEYYTSKETITLSCTIDDYYEFDRNKTNFKGNKVISPNDKSLGKMTFSNGDIVVLMELGSENKDKSFSYYPNSQIPKEFLIVNNSFLYNGMIFQKIECVESLAQLIYEINCTGERDSLGKGVYFSTSGKGKVYVDNVLYKNLKSGNNSFLVDIGLNTANIKFVGVFSQIYITESQSTSAVNPTGKLNDIINWDERYNYTFKNQFSYQVFNKDFILPNHINTITEYTFSYVESDYLITIPKTVEIIEKFAFGGNGTLTSVRFEHDKNQNIKLPIAGGGFYYTGMFYSKTAYNLTIYTDNLIIKNYDWAKDNVTPTFYHLDGTLWE